jgi:hypothetical protein
MSSVKVTDAAQVLYVETTWGGCIYVGKARYPWSSQITHEENIIEFVVWLAVAIFVVSFIT